MGSTKECLIVVLDVRSSANEDFKLKSIKVVSEILKNRICAAKRDYISFVLIGCQRTDNDLNQNVDENSYQNIVQYSQVQLSTWQLLLNFYKFVNEPACDRGDWLDGLVVGMAMQKSAIETFNINHARILLFYDFNHLPNDYESFDVIAENFVKSGIELIVVSHNIAYIDNAETNTPQAIFQNSHKKNLDPTELENQKYALRLVSHCNATLCNFKEALRTVFILRNARPWNWNSKLTIGTKISINISGIIAMKDESNIKLKKVWGETDEIVSREIQCFIKGNQVTPQPEELVDGYMLGGTPVAYDASLLGDKSPQTPGLKFVGFVKRNAIPDEYYCGDSQYLVVHKRNMIASARKLDALVKALHNTGRAILCWRIFSVKFNQPKIVVLLPNDLEDDKPASLSMLELSYHAQHHFWDFPSLRTQKTACKEEQFVSIDKLIDAMDLELTLKDGQQPRETRQHDLLPYDQLPHIFEQNVMDVLERKVLCNASDDDEQFQEMLTDKNFVEIFWKVPERIEEKAKSAANQLQKLFPLEKNTKWLEKLMGKAPSMASIKTEPNEKSASVAATAAAAAPLDFFAVRAENPAKDFEQLLVHHVHPISNLTQRDNKFNLYAKQMREVIDSLLNGPPPLDLVKLSRALKVYRERCCDFNAFTDYNIWLKLLKSKVIQLDLREFWFEVIVKQKLGLCVIGKSSLDEKVRLDEFYTVPDWQAYDKDTEPMTADA